MIFRACVACFVVCSGAVAIAQSPSPRTPAIICGTQIFRVDPRVDSKAVRPVPQGTFTLRTQAPPVCRDTFPAASSNLKLRLPYFLGPKR
jgi:hypothetical protein